MKKVNYLTAIFVLLFSLTPLTACSNNDEQALQSSLSSSTQSESIIENVESSDSSEEQNSHESSSTEAESSSSSEEIEPPTPQVEYAQYIRCTGDNVNIRAGAGTNYSIVGYAEKGTVYAIIEKIGSWYKTYYRNKVAYIYASYGAAFSLEECENDNVENVVAEGHKLMGIPYVYGAVRVHDGKGKLLGGFNAQKFDCSSLVQYVFYKGADVLLQSNTRTQVKQGKYVSKNNIRRGDCLFFTNEDRQYNTGIERVGHVAIYLGDNYILHTSSDYARIEKISAARWKFFIEARRFL